MGSRGPVKWVKLNPFRVRVEEIAPILPGRSIIRDGAVRRNLGHDVTERTLMI